jgi:hypothetical protein
MRKHNPVYSVGTELIADSSLQILIVLKMGVFHVFTLPISNRGLSNDIILPNCASGACTIKSLVISVKVVGITEEWGKNIVYIFTGKRNF